MSVVIAREDVGPCQKRITIEVPAQAVAAEVGRVVGDLRRRIRLPGFRRGKIPASLVRRRFHDDIEREVAQRLVPRYWHQAQAEENLDPLLPPRFEDLKIEEGEPLMLVASVEIRPEIELGELGGFELPEESTEPSDEEVETALGDLRRQHATWIPAARPAARGDRVTALVKDPAIEDSERKIEVEVGGDGVGEELTLALTGLSPGQSAPYRGALGPGAEDRPLRLEIQKVEEQELPELDDALAQRFGDFETVADLRRAVAESIEGSKKTDLRRRRERALLEQLQQRYPLDLPARVVEQESEEMVQRYAGQLAGQGVDLERADLNWEAMLAEVRPQAERRVHQRLLLDAVAQAEGLRLDEREFERFLAGLAAQQKTSTVELRRQLADGGRLEPLRAELLRGQAVRHLLGEDEESRGPSGDETQESRNETQEP